MAQDAVIRGFNAAAKQGGWPRPSDSERSRGAPPRRDSQQCPSSLLAMRDWGGGRREICFLCQDRAAYGTGPLRPRPKMSRPPPWQRERELWWQLVLPSAAHGDGTTGRDYRGRLDAATGGIVRVSEGCRRAMGACEAMR